MSRNSDQQTDDTGTDSATAAEAEAPAGPPPVPILPPAARPGRSRTLQTVVKTGTLTFALVPYRIGDRLRLSAVVDSRVSMEGVVKGYNGTEVMLVIDKQTGEGKYDDWSLEVITSAIPAPPSPEETEAARTAAVATLDVVGGQVVGDYVRKIIEMSREMDDERDLAHYVNRVTVIFKEDEFTSFSEIDEKNCTISPEDMAALQAEAATIQSATGQRKMRHLDLQDKAKQPTREPSS